MVVCMTIFQSTPPAKAGTPLQEWEDETPRISIHTASEGGDLEQASYDMIYTISIHTASEGGDFLLS